MSQPSVTHFDLLPYLGALPVAFGMHRDEIHRLLGSPQTSSPIWNKSGYSQSYCRGTFNVGYDNEWLVNHIGFGPGPISLSIEGRPIWTIDDQPDPNPILLTLDPAPITVVGFWIYLCLGITTTGYHDDDKSQRAITVFPQSKADWFKARATPADTGKYT